jgi:hypothetical protein
VEDSALAEAIFDKMYAFGRPDGNPISAVQEALTPSWLKKAATGASNQGATPEEQAAFISTFGSVAAHLGSAGEFVDGEWVSDYAAMFDGSDPLAQSEAVTRLVEDSQEAAGNLRLTQGIFQFFAPSAPSVEWFLHDPDGNRLAVAGLRELYGKAHDENPDDPVAEFIDTYGVWALLGVQGRYISNVPGQIPVTEAAVEWFDDNDEFADVNPLVAHFFIPQEVRDGPFDIDSYSAILDRGTKTQLDPQGQIDRWLHTVGSVNYRRERDRVEAELTAAGWEGGTMPPNVRDYLSEYDDWLIASTPGYAGRGGSPNLGGAPSREVSRRQLEAAVQHPAMEGNPIAEATADFIELWNSRQDEWDKVLAANPDSRIGRTWESAKDARPLRDNVVEIANYWVNEVPEFLGIYETLFEPEIAQALEKDVGE